MERSCKKCVRGFIEDIWNSNRFELLSDYLHMDFKDYSLPCGLQNSRSFMAYMTELRKNISHQTTIEKITVHQDLIIVSITITFSSLDDPAEKQLAGLSDETLTGHRIFTMSDRRIIAHWEFLDPPAS